MHYIFQDLLYHLIEPNDINVNYFKHIGVYAFRKESFTLFLINQNHQDLEEI
jgi:CMP-2-keto-3-deoxyoctulosonic acid synthetase